MRLTAVVFRVKKPRLRVSPVPIPIRFKMTEMTRPRIGFNADAIATGYKLCGRFVKESFRDYRWLVSNLPGEQKDGIYAIVWHWITCWDLLNLESPNRLPIEVWSDVRSDVSDAFLEQCTKEELAALVNTVRKFGISKQFLFDSLDGADLWIRKQKFDDFDELVTFAYRLGGAPLAAAVPVLGKTKPGFEVAAIKAGQAIFLTQMLVNSVSLFKQNKVFVAQADLEDCEVLPRRIKMRQGGEEWKNLVRLYCSRIEPMFYEGGELVKFLDFDGLRSIKSLLSLNWKCFVQLRRDPELALHPESLFSKRDHFALKFKHFMGNEGKNVPIIPAVDDHAH